MGLLISVVNRKVHYCVHKSPLLSQMNAVYIPTPITLIWRTFIIVLPLFSANTPQ